MACMKAGVLSVIHDSTKGTYYIAEVSKYALCQHVVLLPAQLCGDATVARDCCGCADDHI